MHVFFLTLQIHSISVRNNGGETFREIISANSEQDYIRIEFQETDGSLVKLLVDFKNVSVFFLRKVAHMHFVHVIIN